MSREQSMFSLVVGPQGEVYECHCHLCAWWIARQLFAARLAELAHYDELCRARHAVEGRYGRGRGSKAPGKPKGICDLQSILRFVRCVLGRNDF